MKPDLTPLTALPDHLLACPACHGKLGQTPERLLCAACGRAYPIVDGIPVLIVERAETGKNG